MKRVPWVSVVLAAVAASVAFAEPKPAPCPIVPRPKEYCESGKSVTLLDSGRAAIVLGDRASEPERYAAEYLQTQVERRFQQRLPICVETGVPAGVNQLLLLGQVDTHRLLARLCDEHHIELSSESPGRDGFVIRLVDDGPRQVVLVGGSNARGVIYGQHALFDLLRSEGNAVVFPEVAVRDWPTIAWRGRPHSVLRQHLVPGALDAYLRARINFTDIRDDPNVQATNVFPPRKASMGLPAGQPLDEPLVKRMLAESHRRGLFVYGTVSCGVREDQVDGVLKTFRELIALGVDGLWISFDDTGPGEAAEEVVRRVLKLGAEHGMTGRKIAITPPPKEYQTIDMEFNHQAAAEWGLAQAQWMFTRVPCSADAATAQRIGIQGLPGWWHNLVNFRGGFLHNGGVACSLRTDNRPGYLNMQPLSQGWHAPQYDAIRDAEKNTDCALLWGVVGGWPEEYEVGALGLWAWDPAGHDWQQTRGSIYRHVYGPEAAEAARTFDDKLSALKDLFDMPPWRYWPNKGWPCRLKRVEDRDQALALIEALEKLLGELRDKAPQTTAINGTRLKVVYLEPMQTTLVYARKMALLDYPEYAAPEFERTMIWLVDAGRLDEAEHLLDETRDQLRPRLAQVSGSLAGLKGIDQYVSFWNEQLGSIEQWKARAERRRQKKERQFAKIIGGDAAVLFPYKETVPAGQLDKLFARLADPPSGGQVLAELESSDWLRQPAQTSGAFSAGPYTWKGRPMVAVAYPRGVPSSIGDVAEVCAAVAVPPFAGRLVLDAFVADTRLENRYPGYRYLQLWLGDRMVWERDIAPPQEGEEWVSVDVTRWARPGTPLNLRFRVVDKRRVGDHLSVAFLGPVRLRAKN